MSQNNIVLLSGKNCQLIYDSALLQIAEANFLEQGIFAQAQQCMPVGSGGRGKAWFIELPEVQGGQQMVLRAYQRGGLMARINQQSYVGRSSEKSRSFREWYLLHYMYQQGLPVPQPVAASFCRWPGSLSPLYRARILLKRIPDVQTLDYLLQYQPLSEEGWIRLGECIAAFHRAGIYHDDLNASNILLNQQLQVYLIDFDKGELRKPAIQQSWQQGNLQRLQRSLLKQQSLHREYNYSPDNWRTLMDAYAVSLEEISSS